MLVGGLLFILFLLSTALYFFTKYLYDNGFLEEQKKH